MKKFFKNIGPGPLVAAAFIGPGTVTLCTLAGVNFGYALLWAMVLSVFATLILQEMAARLGIISQKGLSEIIRQEIKNPIFRTLAILLIISAIVIGNAAYEAGNISGGALGMQVLFGNPILEIGSIKLNVMSLAIGLVAFVLLYIGNYKILEKVLVFLVILMSLAFLITAIITKPDLTEILKSIFVPKFPKNSILTIIGLIGTTVVPYNLFLHASLAKTKWKDASDLSYARKDTIIAVVLGGIVSMCIIVSASAIPSQNISNASDLAKGLEPLFGSYAKYFLSIGLFSAGITSAITAPLAAAYVASGCLGWDSNLKSWKFRAVWIFILGLGVLFSTIGFKSIEIIKFAQVANGLLLPVIAGFLLWVMNKSVVLGNYKNSKLQNTFGIIILIITIFLGVKGILSVLNLYNATFLEIDINADVGEGVGNEADLMPYISSCNIACGGHAGDLQSMTDIVRLAIQHNVKIGAHPSFPDKVNFGRVPIEISSANLYYSLKHQIRALIEVLHSENAVLHHIKPHGALYNLAAQDEKIAKIIIEVIKSIALPIKLYAPYNSVIAELARKEHIEVTFEAFADRNYNENLSLVSRQNENALLTKKKAVANHVMHILKHKKVMTINGVEVPIKASTFCVHGDTKNAIKILKYLTKKITKNHILIQ